MEWVSVAERLPERGDRVLMWDAMFHKVAIVFVNFSPEKLDGDYTHWMPLPEPPK